jgi:hypothetical protein
MTGQIFLDAKGWYPSFAYLNNGVRYGEIGFSAKGVAAVYDETSWRTILHSGNYSEYGGVWLANAELDANEMHNGFRAGKLFNAKGVLDAYRVFLEYGFNGYAAQFNSNAQNDLFYRCCENGTWLDWRKVAFTDSNVASATKLATPRTLWGQSFDGTVDIDGDMEWVNSIRYSTLSSAACIYVYGKDYDSRLTRSDIGIKADIVAFSDKVAIGDITATEALHVHGNILATGRIAWNSSRVLKTEVKEHYLSLEKLAQIKPYQYKWKDGRDDLVHVGAIADEVMDITPETVITDINNIHSMDYAQTAFIMGASLTPYVDKHERELKECKETIEKQSETIIAQAERISALENELKTLKRVA